VNGLERAARGLPGGERLTWQRASRYVAGRSRTEALAVAGRLLADGHGAGVDPLGESVTDVATAVAVVERYGVLAAALPAPPADACDVPTRVHVPHGQDWFRYRMRRLAESRGASQGRGTSRPGGGLATEQVPLALVAAELHRSVEAHVRRPSQDGSRRR
jgi:hypothetical protein